MTYNLERREYPQDQKNVQIIISLKEKEKNARPIIKYSRFTHKSGCFSDFSQSADAMVQTEHSGTLLNISLQ